MHRLSENPGTGISSPQNVAGSSQAGLELPSAPLGSGRILCAQNIQKEQTLLVLRTGLFPLLLLCALFLPFILSETREYVFLIIQISKELSMQHFLVPQERSNRCTNTDTEENALEIHLPGEANQNYIDHKRRNYALGLSISAHLNSLCTAGMA